MDDLEGRITLTRSKLKLEWDPQWVVMWDSAKDDLLVITALAELMYAAGLQCFVDGHSGRIAAVGAKEWFKGE